eukprot:TRINITY_DN524_c0_g3_i1.p1 TRINITY_DN524_c0_g3~~TRINITY_DN524_c0_g3_i1.p1  ORF type:complete len:397 (-),score=100.72 TRINITY_DN524_c0_g3_i1:354-1544(-)
MRLFLDRSAPLREWMQHLSLFVRRYRVQGADGLTPLQEAERFLETQKPRSLIQDPHLIKFYKDRKVFGHTESKQLIETQQSRIESHMSPDVVIVSTDPFAARPIEVIVEQRREGARLASALLFAPLLIPGFFVGKLVIDKDARSRAQEEISEFFSIEKFAKNYGVPLKKGNQSVFTPESPASGVIGSLSQPSVIEPQNPENLESGLEASTSSAQEIELAPLNTQDEATITLEDKVSPITSPVNTPENELSVVTTVEDTAETKEASETADSHFNDVKINITNPSLSAGDLREFKPAYSNDIQSYTDEVEAQTGISARTTSSPSDSVHDEMSVGNLEINSIVEAENSPKIPTTQEVKQRMIASLESLRQNPPPPNSTSEEIRAWENAKAELKKSIKML